MTAAHRRLLLVLPAHILCDKTQHGSDEYTGRLLQAKHGWDVLKALKHIQTQSGPASRHAKAAAAIEKRVRKVRQAAAIFAPRAADLRKCATWMAYCHAPDEVLLARGSRHPGARAGGPAHANLAICGAGSAILDMHAPFPIP